MSTCEFQIKRQQTSYHTRPVNFAQDRFNHCFVSVADQQLLPDLPFSIDNLWGIIPCCETDPETGPIIASVVQHLQRYISREQLWIMNGGMSSDNIEQVRAVGGRLLSQDQIFNAINWFKLLPILNLQERPFGRAGKGFNVLASYLALASLDMNNNDAVLHCDSEIAGIDLYQPLTRLYPVWLQHYPQVKHIKMAKAGRNNEVTMSARSLLQNIFTIQHHYIPENVVKFAKELFYGIGPDKWMCTGEWISSGELVKSRLLASGYLEETLQAIWTVHAPACGYQKVRYVANPNNRDDGQNVPRTEDIMMSSIARFIFEITLQGKPPADWNIDEIRRWNQEIMPQLNQVPVIGQDDNSPVEVVSFNSERIIPSVNQLITSDIVNLNQVYETITT